MKSRPCLPQAASSGWAKRCRFSSEISVVAPPRRCWREWGGAEQLLVGDDVGPVVLAGVVDAHQHLGPPGQRGQHLQRLARHRRDAEDDHPARQAGGPLAALGPRVDPAQEGLVHRRPALAGQLAPARRRHVGQQRAPQAGLPALLVGQGAALATGLDQHVVARRPGGQPVGAIHLVLVEQVGQPLGELEALAQVGVPRQEAVQRRVGRLRHHVGQQAHQAPQQQRLVEGRHLGHPVPPQHGPVGLPQKARGQRHVEPGRDPAAAPRPVVHVLGQRQAQPLGHAVAVHQQGLGFERRQRVTPHPRHQQVTQGFRMVAMDEHQAGRQGGRGQGGLLGRRKRSIEVWRVLEHGCASRVVACSAANGHGRPPLMDRA